MRANVISIVLCLFQVITGLILTGLLSRALNVDAYGTYATFVSAILLLAVIAQSGVPDIMLRQTASDADDHPQTLSRLWSRGDLVSLPSLAFAALIGAFLLERSHAGLPEAGQIILLGLHLPLMTLIALRAGALRGLGRANLAHFLMSIVPASVAVMILAAASLVDIPLSLDLAIFANAAGLLVSLCAAQASRDLLSVTPDLPAPSRLSLSDLRRQSLPVAAIAGLGIFNAQIDVLFLGALQGPSSAGLYQVALQSALFISILRPRVGMVVAHRIPRLWAAGDLEGIQRTASPVSMIVSLAAIILLLLSLFYGGDILAAGFGEEYRQAAPILVIVALSHLVTALTGIVGYVLIMTGHQKLTLLAGIGSALINVALNPLLILAFGPTGAAIALLLSMCWWSGFLWSRARKIGIDPSILAWLHHRRRQVDDGMIRRPAE